MVIKYLSDSFKDDAKGIHSTLLDKGVPAECFCQCKCCTRCQLREGTIACFEFAHRTCNRDFIAETACQTLLDNLWFGGLSSNNGNLKLAMCVVIPLVLPLVLLLNKIESEEDEKQVSFPEKICHFYQSPKIKFFNYTFSFLIFLGLYSYFLLIQLNEEFSSMDIVLSVWVFGMLLEEIYEMCTPTTCCRIDVTWQVYCVDYWNVLHFAAIVVYAAGNFTRLVPYEHAIEIARVVLGINLIMFFSSLLHIFSANKIMGPQLIIMAKMIWDIINFMIIMVVIMVAFGVSSYSIIHPNSEPSPNLFFDIFKYVFWTMFGEIFLEDIELREPECSFDPTVYNNKTLPRCRTDFAIYSATVLRGLYSIVCIIMMLNLLIAMFNYSVQKIKEKNDVYWKYQQYGLVYEYCKRLVLPPPLTLIVLLVKGIALLVSEKGEDESDQDKFLEQYFNTRTLNKKEEKAPQKVRKVSQTDINAEKLISTQRILKKLKTPEKEEDSQEVEDAGNNTSAINNC